MIFKSFILEKNTKLINQKLFLFYGENEGLKKEFKNKLIVDHKGKEIIKLFQEDIIKNKDILTNEILNKSLFGQKKIFFIDQVNDKILHILEETEKYIQEETIFLFSEILEKKSKLRTYFEKSKNYGVTACYQDNEISIKAIISNKLKSFQNITPQIINYIIQNTGLDRSKIENEITKIESYFDNNKIDFKKLELLLNIKNNDDFNKLKDEALKGNKTNTNRLLADTVFETENNIYYLNSINQTINRLNQIVALKKNGINIESIITTLKPPVFWKDKPILIEQSKKWNKNKIQRALNKTFKVELAIKTNATIKKELLIKNLIIELCTSANDSLAS
jgi:DNA polymerase III subunit delta